MAETWRTRLCRWLFNVYPAYRGTGARVTYIAGDWSEVRIRLPLNWRTRNRVKTIFGGSMYGALDPIYMLMLMKHLGPEYVVWDKAANIRFRRPGREQLYAVFQLSAEQVAAIRHAADENDKTEPEFTVNLVSASGEVHAICHKLLHVRRRATARASVAPQTA
jgi:acyl-coenzyme A thioesterase PaaI-like protein